jgi:hypothetical protein
MNRFKSDETYFIHLVGLEGVGHHGVHPILLKIIKNFYGGDRLVDQGGDLLLCPLRDILDDYFAFKRDSKSIFLNRISHFARENKNKIIIFDNSYPCGLPSDGKRDVENQYDILEMNEVLSNFGTTIFIHLKRDLLHAVAARAYIDGGLIPHAKVISKINKYLNNQIEELKKIKQVHVFTYETMSAYLIAEALGVLDYEDKVDSVLRELWRPSMRNIYMGHNQLHEYDIKEMKEILDI